MRIEDTPFNRAKQVDFELFVCGYENRATYVARLSSGGGERVAIDYEAAGVLSYDANISIMNSIHVARHPEPVALAKLDAAIERAASIRVDVSSMRRSTIATIVQRLFEAKATNVEFTYAPADYMTSSRAALVDVALSAAPVSEFFAGVIRPASVPLGLVIGLGLERHRAIGLFELLEPARTWAFVAQSDDGRFSDAAKQANPQLFEEAGSMPYRYDIRSITRTFIAVESLLHAASPGNRLVVAPSGPKMFALASMLAAVAQPIRPAIWRVGAQHSLENPTDVLPTGDVVAARASFDLAD